MRKRKIRKKDLRFLSILITILIAGFVDQEEVDFFSLKGNYYREKY